MSTRYRWYDQSELEEKTMSFFVSGKTPNTPSSFLTFALKCLDEYECYQKTGSAITYWHLIVARVLIGKPRDVHLRDIKLKQKLISARKLAAGDTRSGILWWPTIMTEDFWITDDHVTSYQDCPNDFKKYIRGLIGELKLAGI